MDIPLELERPPEPCLISRHFHEFVHLDGRKGNTHEKCTKVAGTSIGVLMDQPPVVPGLKFMGTGARWAHFGSRSALFLLK